MEGLIADLLDLARLDEQRGQRGDTLVELRSICQRALDQLPPTDVAVDLAQGDDVSVRGSLDQLERAVLNLVLNAGQHAASRVLVEVRVLGSRA